MPRGLGCHALEAGLGLVGSRETPQTLKQKRNRVRIYGQKAFGLHEVRLEQRVRDWGLLEKCKPER